MSAISVIIPSYNAEKWIRETLNSCLAQKEFLREVIVVDDHSTDDSWNILTEYGAEYPGLVRIYRNMTRGGNNARNYGFSLSSGAFIQWLDADDQLLPDKFSTQLNAFDRLADADIVYSDWQLNTYDDRREVVRTEYKRHRQYEDFLFELLVDNWSPPHNYLIRREMAERLYKMGAWNPDTKVGQDREYYTIGAIIGARFAYTPGNFAVYNRWNRSSVSAAAERIRYESQEKLLDRFEVVIREQDRLSAGDRKRYQRIINTHKLLIRAAGYPADLHFKNDLHIGHIEWKLVHGIRTMLKLVREVIKEMF